jgi:hypothetical protein
MKIDLQIRDLETGNTSQKAFESIEACESWLKERPKYTEVLGIASHHIPAEISDQLKAARRALDEEEEKLVEKLDQAVEAAHAKAAEMRRAEEAAAAEKHRKEMGSLDDDAPMTLRFLFNKGVCVADTADKREPSEDCLAAVKAWIEERNSWVEGRGQVVGDANIQVYPGKLPEGAEGHVISGTFVPVSAPSKG